MTALRLAVPAVLLLSSLLVLFSPGCSGDSPAGPGSGKDCPACSAGELCDPDSGECVPELAEGAACGFGVVGICGEAMGCGPVGGTVDRCALDCRSSDADQVCGLGRKCFARPGAQDATRGFCASAMDEGQPCDSAMLAFCSGKALSCITSGAELTAGKCFRLCDPAAPQCGTGQDCADPFAGQPNLGICAAIAGHFPDRCDHTEMKFCGRGEMCARPGQESWGHCHRRCQQDGECDGGEVCIEPSTGIRFCGVAVNLDEHCAAEETRYCGRESLCVRVADDTVCKLDCTDTDSCPKGRLCSPLGGSERKACL